MPESSWKSFDRNEVTHSMAHYLMAIQALLARRGYARATDVAEHLDITRASASVAIAGLRARGLVEEDRRRFLRLTEEGEALAQTIVRNRLLLIRFLRDVLLVDPDLAEIDACKTEHLLSSEAGERLFRMLGYLFEDSRRTARIHEAVRESERACPGLEACKVCQPFHECILTGRLDGVG